MARPSEPMQLASTGQPNISDRLQPFLILIASTTLVFTGCGINFTFGVFQELYESMSKLPNTPFTGATPAQIDLIGTLSIALMTIGAPFTTAWTKQYSPRAVIWSGGLIYSLSLVLASFSQALWQFILTQGLLLGIGTCMAYMPSVTVAPTWFSRHRGLAMGIILSGTGVGGVVWPLAFRSLIERVGFRNCLRITSGICLVLILGSGSFMKWHASQMIQIQAENTARTHKMSILRIPLVDWRVARTRKFAAHALGAALQSAAYYTPVFFFASYARTLGYSQATSANFIAISNAANALGKIAIGYVADRMGRLNTLFLTTLISAIAVLAFWLPSALSTGQTSGSNLFIVFTIFYGVFASAYVSLFPTSLVELFGVHNFASVNGVLYMVRGLATLLGTPIAGLLIRSSQHKNASPKSYENTSIMVGALLVAATFAVLWARIEATITLDGGQGPRRKWMM
ncbi:Major facilitator superfamily domain general substrate transporter [Penicillium macrosclerotiorum]|uniref:Major facilitator superfamily domain general substrate transporter n=1 Tax=Penicillium macrosclerotiorum TaxID=303699 RepID=UPI002546ECEE|nr:Major facilitator superfamily domain general substrate transporter [Penicillium macrosclerotiorum]KAJ5666668.1 Major facilitator superfamily domain general substrate transporter [Penicillium macrosclerotiorum]